MKKINQLDTTKNKIKLRNITYISPLSHSKTNIVGVKQLNNSMNRNRENIYIPIKKTNNISSNDLYRNTSSSHSQSQIYSIRKNSVNKISNHNHILMATPNRTNNYSTHKYNTRYNILSYSSSKKKVAGNLIKSSSTSSYNTKSKLNSNYKDIKSSMNSFDLNSKTNNTRQYTKHNLLDNSSSSTNVYSNTKVYYDESNKKNKNYLKTRIKIDDYNQNHYINKNKQNLLKNNNNIKTEFNTYQSNNIDKIETPEELHFYYVQIFQKGKKFKDKFGY